MNRRDVLLLLAAGAGVIPVPVRASAGHWESVVRDAAARYGVDPGWLVSVMYCESGGDPNAYNERTGDTGLMQFNPATWAEFCGYRGMTADIWDGYAQADMAAWAFAHGLADRWCCSGLFPHPEICQ